MALDEGQHVFIFAALQPLQPLAKPSLVNPTLWAQGAGEHCQAEEMK